MQEYKCFEGGACLAISLEGRGRLHKRKGNDQEIKKRPHEFRKSVVIDSKRLATSALYGDGSAQLWISKSHVAPDKNELHPLFCLCDSESPDSWSNTGITPSSSVCPLPAQDSSTRRNHSTSTTTNASGCPWTDLLNSTDNVSYFMKNINGNPNEQIVILYNDNAFTKLFSDAFDCRESWPVGSTGRCINNNLEDVYKATDLDSSNIPNNKNRQCQRDVINKEQTDRYVCDDGRTGKTSGGIRRKSVSFADDVIVYLYDKDSPTDESRLESSSSLTSDILFDDNGLEWEDDFLALVKSRQSHSHSESRRSACPPLPTQNWTVKKRKSFALSQSCLFLTHVSESDLEL